jgi:hypothetical protein
LKRGARASAKGAFFDDDLVAGWPVSTWLALTEECFSIGANGYSFYGWPDGRPLIEQEQCVVDIMKVILIELIKEFSDGTKKRNPVQR